MMEILQNVVLSASGASIVLMVLARLVPNDRLLAWCRAAGAALSGFGRGRLGRGFWEQIESFVENSIAVAWQGFREGLNRDDAEQDHPAMP